MRQMKFLIASGLVYGSLVFVNKDQPLPPADTRIEIELSKVKENFKSSMINVPYIEVSGEFISLEKESEFLYH
jgi:hypothetical protein